MTTNRLNRVTEFFGGRKAVRRASAVFLAVFGAPYLFAIPLFLPVERLGIYRLANDAMSAVLLWYMIVLPPFGLVVPNLNLVLLGTLAEWALVALALGRLTRDMSFARTFLVAATTVVLVGVGARLLFYVLGYQVVIEGP